MSEKKIKHLWMVEDLPASAKSTARARWTKVGVAFENRDGSWNIELAAIPVSGRLQLRDPKPDDLKDAKDSPVKLEKSAKLDAKPTEAVA